MTEHPPEHRPYQPYGTAVDAFYCRDRVQLFHGPVRTGKSLCHLTKLYVCCEQFPGIHGLILRQTRKSLTTTGLITWEDQVVPVGHPILKGAHREQRSAYHFPNGSEVMVGGMDDPAKIMSGEFDLIVIIEANDVAEEAFAMLTTRNARYHPGIPFNQIMMDCNPQQATHWLKRRMDNAQITGFRGRIIDNPKYWDMERGTFTPAGRELMKTLDDMPPMMQRRLRDGEWVAAEGAIYDIFDIDRDVIAPHPIPDHWPRLVGLDFGAVNTAALFYAEDPDNGDLTLYREYHAGGRTAAQHTIYLRLGEPENLFVVGGAGAEGQWRREFAAAGLTVRQPDITDVALGISRVYGQHKRRAIRVFDTCTGYLEQKTSYRYRPEGEGQEGEIENKSRWHYMDAERYIVGYPRRTPQERAMQLNAEPAYVTN